MTKPISIPGVELEAPLGTGGSSAMYAGRQQTPDRPVAVKVLLRGLNDRRLLERFEREAQVLMTLRSPHICRGFGYGHLDNGAPYLILERLFGEDLDSRMRREPRLGDREVLSLACQIAAGMRVAHASNVVHRDLRPTNIFLCETSDPAVKMGKILEFGVSAFSDDAGVSGRLTKTGEFLGTADFMAPEQARGGHNRDPRTDIYALAAVTYRLLSGTTPHGEGAPLDVAVRKVTQPPTPLAEHRPDLPDLVSEVLMPALERELGDRPLDMEMFEGMLKAALQSVGGRASDADEERLRETAMTTALVVVGRGPMPAARARLEKAGVPTVDIGPGKVCGLFPVGASPALAIELGRSLLEVAPAVCVVTVPAGSAREALDALPHATRSLTIQVGKVVVDPETEARLGSERQALDDTGR